MDVGYDGNTDAAAYPVRAHTAGVEEAMFFNFLVDDPERNSECNSYIEGASIYIHNPMELPYLSNHYLTHIPDFKMLQVNVEPDVIMTSEDVKHFSADKRKCYLSHERALKFFRFYTQSNCDMECLANFTLTNCDCIPFFLPRLEGDKICGSGSEDCVGDAKGSMFEEEMVKKIAKEKTLCDCLPSCTDWKYKSESSLLEVDFKRFFKKFGSVFANVTYSAATIAFKSSQFRVVERKELFGVFDLISNFGGLLGLFIGFSIISLLEIVYFCTWRIFFNKKLYGSWNGEDRKSVTKQS